MTQTQITKCPKCDTTFRVTPTQLQAAKGAVRCGACLHVFRASQHFIEEKKTTLEPQDDRTQDLFDDELFEEPVATTQSMPKNTADDGLIHDDMDDSIHDDFLIDDDNGLIDDDHGLIEDKPKSSSIINDIDESFLSINPDEIEDPFFSDSEKLAETVKESEDEDEAWAQALLDDSDDDHLSSAPAKKAPNKPVPTSVSQTTFTYIEDDPLDLSLPQKRNLARIWGFAAACLLLAITLVGQIGYFKFDELAKKEQYRPLYQLVCNQLGCTLPSTFDLGKIRTTASPQVSSHPEFENALMVDILFMNHAEYDQVFPRIELAFSNSNEKVIARRVFKASEYLAGEAAGLTQMPSQTPVHIALEIRDPGSAASNYQVRFLAP
jgi:predicted Zn finger-like uncharacterized protein